MKDFFIDSISFYQKKISPHLPARCRYYPTCSAYMKTAIERFGPFRGILMGTLRLLRCNVFFPGGYDPVPEIRENKQRKQR